MGIPKKITGSHSHQRCYELKENGNEKKKHIYDDLISITFTIIIPYKKREREWRCKYHFKLIAPSFKAIEFYLLSLYLDNQIFAPVYLPIRLKHMLIYLTATC